MGKVIMSGIVPQLEVPSIYKANFADNDWATIIDAVQKNKVPETWKVGDQKTMTINGTDYAIDIIGKNHDDYADGSGKAPLTFQTHSVYDTTCNMYNTYNYSWDTSIARGTTLPQMLSVMPAEVQAGIREVSKLTSVHDESPYAPKSTSDKLFFLSAYEAFGEFGDAYCAEGVQYAYYKAGNSRTKNKAYWLRSPTAVSSSYCCAVNSTNQLVSFSAVTGNLNIAPAFCF